MSTEDREMGRLEAKVDLLMEMMKGLETRYVTKAEYEPRITALESNSHRIWDKIMAVSALCSFIIAAIALLRTFHG